MFTRIQIAIIRISILLFISWSFVVTAKLPEEVVDNKGERYTQAFINQGVDNQFEIIDIGSAQSIAQDSNTTLIGRWAGGPCMAVSNRGNTAYYGNGGYLEIVDFSDPINPINIGRVAMPSIIQGIKLVGNYAYIANGDFGVRVINISDPSNPFEESAYNTDGFASNISIDGNIAFLADGDVGMHIIDISDPANLKEVGFYDTDGFAYDIGVSGDYAYIADGDAGLCVLDISDYSNLFEVSHLNTNGETVGLSINDNLVFLADYDEGMQVIDKSDPMEIARVGLFSEKYIIDVEFKDGKVYAAALNGLCLIDVNEPSSPKEIGYYDTWGNPQAVAINGDSVFIADRSKGLWLFTTFNNSIRKINNVQTGWKARAVSVNDGFIYIAEESAGLWVIDEDVPEEPNEVSIFETDGSALSAAASDSFAYLACGSDEFRVINISDPVNISNSYYYRGSFPTKVRLEGKYAYVVDDGLQIFDISAPNRINRLGSFTTKSFESVCAKGNMAYGINKYADLTLINVSDPNNPIESGFLEIGGYATDIDYYRGFVYISNKSNGIRIIDVSEESNPVEVNLLDTKGSAESVRVLDGYAYVADGGAGLSIYEVIDPLNPVLVGYYETVGAALDISVKKNYNYIAKGYKGLSIIRNDGYTEPTKDPIKIWTKDCSAMTQDTIFIPVKIKIPEGIKITDVSMLVSSFNDGLKFVNIDTTSTLTGYANWNFESLLTDTLFTKWSTGTEAIGESGVFTKLVFKVTGKPGTFIPVTINSATFDSGEDSILISNGGVWVYTPGDVDNNQNIQAFDAALILKNLVGLTSFNHGDSAAADVTQDHSISAFDASVLLQYGVGLVDSLPYDTADQQLLANGNITLSDQSIAPGATISVPITVENGANLLGVEATFEYNPAQLEYTGVRWDKSFEWNLHEVRDNEGRISITAASIEANAASGEIAQLQFKVRADFSTDKSIVSLKRLRLNENPVQADVATATLSSTTGVTDESAIPDTYVLHQNHPNPFNPVTTIRYGLPKETHITLTIYDLMGHQVAMLVNAQQQAGWYTVQWDGLNRVGISVSTGVYIYRIEASDFQATQKMVYMK
ncbi:MAG: T9SS type A sorting domain-containing protein [Candidatus Marinimicrobia bacterium]|nr:T9SS type A sorting domain-containing protein [Candidatus Neomarinimicrobiota bacterium]MCF7828393.1 T9SS type A sorting domain-containing protein [Candidatus Neomarinimicrobiota bacterium]MCF7881013.1 T9SS type A sorting domain-containing protein [Candidatus Neomarinimicrobiota bacterium]